MTRRPATRSPPPVANRRALTKLRPVRSHRQTRLSSKGGKAGRGTGRTPDRTAGPGPGESGPPATEPDGVSFSAEDRQQIRKSAEDAAWTRSHLTVRSLDARAHERAKARREKHGRRWLRSGLKAAAILAFAVFGPALGAMGEYRYGVVDMASVLGAELDEDASIPPGNDGG